MKTPSGTARDVLLILASSCMIITSGEVLLRAFYGSQGSAQPVDSQQEVAFQSHPRYLVGLKPNLHDRTFKRESKQGAVITHWNTNAVSFRGPNIQDKSGVRIIVYGDSNIFARFSNLEDTFPYQLEHALKGLTKRSIEVLNAGVPGFGPDQSLLRFEEEVEIYKPDIIVFHVFADNDWGDLIRNRLVVRDSQGRLMWTHREGEVDICLRWSGCGGLLKEPVLGVISRWASSLLIVQAGTKLVRMVGFLPASEPSSDKVINYYLNMSEQEFTAFRGDDGQATSHFIDHYDYDLALLPSLASSQEKVLLMDALLLSAYETARLHGVKFVLLLEPSSRDLTKNLRPNYEDFSNYAGYSRRRLTSIIADAARKHQIPFVDLYEIFLSNNPETLYWDDTDDHWNHAGQRLAAIHAAKFLTDHILHD